MTGNLLLVAGLFRVVQKSTCKIIWGVAVKEYRTDAGPADYVLFVSRKPVGVVEAKREEEGATLSVHEDQAEGYASARLKYLNNDKLPFVYVSTVKTYPTLSKKNTELVCTAP